MTQHTMTRDAGAISIRAYEHATRLGHPYLGEEHYLLALAAADQPAGTVLREQGVTPGRVEAEIVRLSGAGLFDDLDRGALTTVGIDVDAVRAATDATFGRAALALAARDVHRGRGPVQPAPPLRRYPGRGLPARPESASSQRYTKFWSETGPTCGSLSNQNSVYLSWVAPADQGQLMLRARRLLTRRLLFLSPRVCSPAWPAVMSEDNRPPLCGPGTTRCRSRDRIPH